MVGIVFNSWILKGMTEKQCIHNLNVNVNSTFSVSTMSAGSFDNMIQKPTLRKHTKVNLFCHILYIYRNIYIYIYIYIYILYIMIYVPCSIYLYMIYFLYIYYIYMYIYVCVCNMTYITHIYRYRHIWYMKLESNL